MTWTTRLLLCLICVPAIHGCKDERQELLDRQSQLVEHRNQAQKLLENPALTEVERAKLQKEVRDTQAQIDQLNWELFRLPASSQ